MVKNSTLVIHQLKIFFKLYTFNSIFFNLYIWMTLSVRDVCILLLSAIPP